MRRLFPLLLALAMLLAPLTMLGGGAATAMPHDTMASMDHCAGMDEPSQDRPGADIDCMMVCAAVPPPLAPRLDSHTVAPAALPHFAVATAPHGLDPEAETPPPRFS